MKDYEYDVWLANPQNRARMEYDPNGRHTPGQLKYYRWLCTKLDIPAGLAQHMLDLQYNTYGKLFKRCADLYMMYEKVRMSDNKDQVAATRKRTADLKEPPSDGQDMGAVASSTKGTIGSETTPGGLGARAVEAAGGPVPSHVPIGLIIVGTIIIAGWCLMRRR